MGISIVPRVKISYDSFSKAQTDWSDSGIIITCSNPVLLVHVSVTLQSDDCGEKALRLVECPVSNPNLSQRTQFIHDG